MVVERPPAGVQVVVGLFILLVRLVLTVDPDRGACRIREVGVHAGADEGA